MWKASKTNASTDPTDTIHDRTAGVVPSSTLSSGVSVLVNKGSNFALPVYDHRLRILCSRVTCKRDCHAEQNHENRLDVRLLALTSEDGFGAKCMAINYSRGRQEWRHQLAKFIFMVHRNPPLACHHTLRPVQRRADVGVPEAGK